MAWKEKKSDKNFGNYVKWEIGTELEGVFLGTSARTDRKGQNFKVRTRDGVEMEATFGYQLQQELGDVPVGSRVKIVCIGKARTNNGNTVNKFRIFVDDGEAGAANEAESEYAQLERRLKAKDPQGAAGILAALKQLYKDDGARLTALREAAAQAGA